MSRFSRTALPLAAILSGLPALVPAAAQSTTETTRRLVLSAQAQPACVISAPTAEGGVNATFTSQGATSGEIAIGQLVDPVSATAQASAIAIDLPVICNTSHVLTVRSANGGLARGGVVAPATGAFREFLPYRVSVDWAGQALAQASDAGTAQLAVATPAQGTARIGFATTAGGDPLVSGQYTDALIVELAPTN